ncbi:MAG TPA: hypothetical protein VF220_05475 [Nitrososphaeraceae archaeon]
MYYFVTLGEAAYSASVNLLHSSNDNNKQRKRKWVKYERKHSMSLWHTDWYQIKDDDRCKCKKWLIPYLGDTLRIITGYGIFD